MASPRKDPLDSARKGKDKSYKHVFKGSVLINTLMEYDKSKFINRDAAISFGQRLLDLNHIESIIGDSTFEDGSALYRWCDETLVRQAKKMVTTTTSHIPKRRLIELLDLQQGDGKEDGYDMDQMRNRVVGRLDGSVDMFEMEGESTSETTSNSSRNVGRLSRRDLQEFESRQNGDDYNQSSDGRYEANIDDDRKSSASDGHMDDFLGLVSEGMTLKTDYHNDVDYAISTKHFLDEDSDNTPHHTGSSETPSDLESPCLESDSPLDTYMVRSETEASDAPSTCSIETTPSQYSIEKLREQEKEAIEDLEAIQQSLRDTKNSESLVALERSLADLTQQSSGFSDNEKQLLEQMRRMQSEHQHVVSSYEDRIKELMEKVTGLRGVTDRLEDGTTSAEVAKDGSDVAEAPSAPEAPPIPKAPQAPNAPPVPNEFFLPKVAQPNKTPVKPRVKMRPLFWNRIIIENKDQHVSQKTVRAQNNSFWQKLTEPNFDVSEFEDLFGKDPAKEKASTRSLHDAMSPTRGVPGSKIKTAKILEDSRSRNIGIKLRSMHCQMGDVKDAVYDLDFDKLDEEGLFGLYELRGTKEEIDKIESYKREHRNALLDQPEQFILEISKMCHFEERVECLILRKRFNESLFNIDEQLNALLFACDDLKTNITLKTVMETVLAFGNYMNGGTQRGQADGFDITILPRLKDVKSMDNATTLLAYLVRTHTREHEDDAGQNDTKFKLPDPSILQQASVISLADLEKELNVQKQAIKSHLKKADLIFNNSDPKHLQPFRDVMEDFFESAEQLLKRQNTKCMEAKSQFELVLDYFNARNIAEKVTTDVFFSLWSQFLTEYKKYWEVEQKRIAREMFAKIEKRKKERRQRAQRRKSIVEDGKSNMKQKFAQIRRRSEVVAPHTAALLRSHSVSSIDTLSSQSSLERSLDRKRERTRERTRDERNSQEERKRQEKTTRTRPSNDDDSVFGDDEMERKRDATTKPTPALQTSNQENSPRRRRTLAGPPSKAEVNSSSGVDESRIKDGPNIPSRFTALGDTNVKLKYYYRKGDTETSKTKDDENQNKKDLGERQRHKFATETVTKTGESMIERLQRRRRNSRVETEGVIVSEDQNTDNDGNSVIQDRMQRRRRSRVFDDNESIDGTNLTKSQYTRRSRNNIFSDTESESGRIVDQVPTSMRRSRASLLSDTESDSSRKTLTNMPSSLRRSRSSLTQSDTSSRELSVAKSWSTTSNSANPQVASNENKLGDQKHQMSSHLRRSRTNLFDDSTKNEQDSRHGYLRRSRSDIVDDLHNENKSGGVPDQTQETKTHRILQKSRSNIYDDVNHDSKFVDASQGSRLRTRPSATSDIEKDVRSEALKGTTDQQIRRRLPQEPRSRASYAAPETRQDESLGSSWIKNKVFDSIKDTVNSASAGISALAQKFDQTISNTATIDSKKPDTDQNQNLSNLKDKNDPIERRVRSRRLSDQNQPIAGGITNPTTSNIVQEKSRMFTRSNTTDIASTQRTRLRPAQSMDALNMNKTPSTLNSGASVRDRMSSFETGNTGTRSRSDRSSSPSGTSSRTRLTRSRSRAGSEVNLTQPQLVDGSIVPKSININSTDKEALRSRDYRDVLKKLSRTRATSSHNLSAR